MMSIEEMETTWSRILDEVSKDIPPVYFDPFISPLTLINLDNEKLILKAPSETIKNHVEKKYQRYLENAIEKIKGNKIKIEIHFDTLSSNPISNFVTEKFKDENFTFNPDYTFDKFFSGDSNRIVLSAIKETILKPGEINPLFIFGKHGTGKTHLCHGIGLEYKLCYPDTNVKYTTMSSFMTEFIYNVQNRQAMEAFKNKYQSYDALIIDDIQNLTSGAEKTQEEFFNLFNHLYERRKQIIITSDRPISELPVQDRLKSRFITGFQVELKPADLQVRTSIVQSRLEQLELKLTDESIQHILNNIGDDARALIGSINDLLIYKRAYRILLLSDAHVKEALDNRLLKIKNMEINHEKIIDHIANQYSVLKKDILSKSRKAEFIIPRHLSMYFLHTLCNMNKTMIGRIFSTKHTTVINAVKRIEIRMKADRNFEQTVLSIRQLFEYK